jgi:hypothetical protein
MSLVAFKNQNELISYANWFVKERIEVFRKDVSICLTPDKNRRHAYMPALLTCISLLELLSGLYTGKLKNIRLSGLLKYSQRFLDSNLYSADLISVLYEMFRHKIAHELYKKPQRLITWQVFAESRDFPIEIIQTSGTLTRRPPWPVKFTHKCIVSIYRLKVDFVKSAIETGGYLSFLRTDVQSQTNFEKCMLEYFKR